MKKCTDNKIPLELLFAKPHKDQLRISPGGNYLAWRGRVDGTLNIFIQKLNKETVDSGKSIIDPNNAKQVTFYDDRDACSFFLFTPDEKTILFLRDTKRGSECYHLYAIDIDQFFDRGDDNTSQYHIPAPRNLIQNPNMTCAMGFTGGVQLWTTASSSFFSPRTVFLSTAPIGPYALFWEISRIDIDTAERVIVERNLMVTLRGRLHFLIVSLVYWIMMCLLNTIKRLLPFIDFVIKKIDLQPPGIPIQWFPDDEMQFRGRIEVHLNMSFSFSARKRADHGKWKSIHTVSFKDTNLQLFGSSGGSGTARMDFSPSRDDSDTVGVHLCAFGNCDTTSYERFDLKTGKHLTRLTGNKKVDIAGFVDHPVSSLPEYVMYEWEKLTTEAILSNDKEGHENKSSSLADLAFLHSFFEPSMIFYIISRTHDCTAWIIYAVSDVGQLCCEGSPGGYFLFCRSNLDRKMHLVFPSRPELCQYELSTMKPIHARARDGEDIMCYLSSPPDSENKPLVLYIHGGPQARDHWGYHPVCQFLCNRGFRTLQVNYRGSTGFGERFLKLGMDGQFYQSLQTDITDAATSMAGKDIAILGASFGGYSALWGITSEPMLYKCAVAICPLTVVGAANEQGSKMFGGSPLITRYWQHVFGEDVSQKKGAAIKASPLYQLDRLANGACIQLFHGENDPRSPFEHSIRVVDELKKQIGDGKNISVELVSFKDEGHGISKEANVLYMYNRIEEFLCNQFNRDSCGGYLVENSTATVRWSAKNKPDPDVDEQNNESSKKQQ